MHDIPSLPKPLRAWLQSEAARSPGLLAECFTPDATVEDENQSHGGLEAIAAWQRSAHEKYQHRVTPLKLLDGSAAAPKLLVKVDGNFPGSPVQLVYEARLAGDRIAGLRIRLATASEACP